MELKYGALWQPGGVGWSGGWEGGLREREDICIPMADSHWCMAETNTML